MRAFSACVLPLLAAFASAQSPRIVRPGYLELGGYFPNYRRADFGHDFGVAAGLGYAFAERGDFRLSGEVRGAVHIASLGRGASGLSADETSLTLGTAAVGLRHRHHGTALFTGLALGVGVADLDGGDSRTEAIVAAEVGFDLTKSVYVAARYQHSSADTLRGATLGLGFRF